MTALHSHVTSTKALSLNPSFLIYNRVVLPNRAVGGSKDAEFGSRCGLETFRRPSKHRTF